MLYTVLDILFVVFHTALILFNVSGWIWKKTQKANLITLLLTGSSWFILGIFYGIGYCPLTDWHWEILEQLGKTNLPDSYMKYLFDRITGIGINDSFVDTIVAAVYFISLIISIIVNVLRRKK